MSATILSCVLLLLATTVTSNVVQNQETTTAPSTTTSPSPCTSTPVPTIIDVQPASGSQESNEDCDGGYKRYSGSCYKPHNETATWDKANEVCKSEGGYLVEINDAAELQVVMEIRPEITVFTWVGLRKGPDGEWRTVKGRPLDSVYNLWSEDRNNENDCGLVSSTGRLDDLKCDKAALNFLCEK